MPPPYDDVDIFVCPVGVGVLDDPSAIVRLPLTRQRDVREAVPYDSGIRNLYKSQFDYLSHLGLVVYPGGEFVLDFSKVK